MDLHIDNATLEEITDICHRIGEVTFWEVAKENHEKRVEENMQAGLTQDEAIEKVKEEYTEKTNKLELHLDEAPAKNKRDIMQLAIDYQNKFGKAKLKKLISEFGFPSIANVPANKQDEVCDVLEKELNG